VHNSGNNLRFSDILSACLAEFPSPSPALDRSRRLSALGTWVAELAARPLREFQEYIDTVVYREVSQGLGWLENEIATTHGAPAYWVEDVKTYMLAIEEALGRNRHIEPVDMQWSGEEIASAVQCCFLRFGRLLQTWDAITGMAAELRHAGKPLGCGVHVCPGAP
jgi:hypothetical protein